MGSYNSKQHADEEFLRTYVTTHVLMFNLLLQHNVEIKPSTIPGAGNGLFTKIDLKKGDCLAIFPHPGALMCDPMLEMDKIKAAKTKQEFRDALAEQSREYYKRGDRINMRLARLIQAPEVMTMEAIKDIPAGSELFRVYGFSAWFRELLPILTVETFPGWYEFQEEYLELYPLEDKNGALGLRESLKLFRPFLDNPDGLMEAIAKSIARY